MYVGSLKDMAEMQSLRGRKACEQAIESRHPTQYIYDLPTIRGKMQGSLSCWSRIQVQRAWIWPMPPSFVQAFARRQRCAGSGIRSSAETSLAGTWLVPDSRYDQISLHLVVVFGEADNGVTEGRAPWRRERMQDGTRFDSDKSVRYSLIQYIHCMGANCFVGASMEILRPFSVPPTLQLLALVGVDGFSLIADSVICTDEDGRIVLFNRAAEQSFGYSAAEVIGQHVEMLLPERHRAEHAHQVRSFALGDGADNRLMGHQREVWGQRKSGEEFPSEATVSRQSVDGRMILTVVHRDITERKELEKLHEAIEHELDHRIQNLFSVVSSLVSLSAKSASSVEELRDSLQERLRALAETQAFLRRGRRGSISLSELLRAELAHYRNPDGTNLIIRNASVELGWSAAQTLALVLHELATNSAKYGAFSDARGRVTVTSECMSDGDEPLLAIEWRETGGPPVTPPRRQGFGTMLIEQVIKRAFRAEIIVDYRPEGLVCRMVLPKSAVEARPEAQVRGASVKRTDVSCAPTPAMAGEHHASGVDR